MVTPRQAWLVPYLRLQQRYDIRINTLLSNALVDAESAAREIAETDGIGAQVRRGQLTTTRAAINRALADFWRDLGNTMRAGQFDAAALALERSFDWDEGLFNQVFDSQAQRDAMKRYLVSNADRNIELMLARVFGGRIPLSQQVYRTSQLANGWVERVVNSGIARGSSADDIARTVRASIRPDVPGGVSYAARRLGRTELNRAYHGKTIAHNMDKPWNTGMRWQLSRSHPEHDICDSLTGVYSLSEVPAKPHPQCLCYIYPETVSQEQFVDGFLRGDYDIWLRDHYGPASFSEAVA